jgi:hypothetical protein
MECNAIAVRIPKDHHPAGGEIVRPHNDGNAFGLYCSQGGVEIRYFERGRSTLG